MSSSHTIEIAISSFKSGANLVVNATVGIYIDLATPLRKHDQFRTVPDIDPKWVAQVLTGAASAALSMQQTLTAAGLPSNGGWAESDAKMIRRTLENQHYEKDDSRRRTNVMGMQTKIPRRPGQKRDCERAVKLFAETLVKLYADLGEIKLTVKS